jgi:hypothetical protein
VDGGEPHLSRLGTEYLHGGLGIASGALKPLAKIMPVVDAIAFLGDLSALKRSMCRR